MSPRRKLVIGVGSAAFAWLVLIGASAAIIGAARFVGGML